MFFMGFFSKLGGRVLIKVENITKQFKTNKKYPGFKGAIKSFFSREYTIKNAVENRKMELLVNKVEGN